MALLSNIEQTNNYQAINDFLAYNSLRGIAIMQARAIVHYITDFNEKYFVCEINIHTADAGKIVILHDHGVEKYPVDVSGLYDKFEFTKDNFLKVKGVHNQRMNTIGNYEIRITAV